MTVRDAIVAFAQSQEGKPYAWGATGPNSYDCSGLVYAAERAAGLNVSRSTSINEVQRGTQIDKGSASPGDLVYVNGGGYEDHSGIYLGGGKMIDAPDVGQTVGVHNVPSWASFWTPPGQGPGPGGTASGGGGGLATQAAGFLGIPSAADLGSLALKLLAGAIAGAMVVVGVKETMRGSSS